MWNSVCVAAARRKAPFDVVLLLDEHIKAPPGAARLGPTEQNHPQRKRNHSWLKQGQQNLLRRWTVSVSCTSADFYLHVRSSWQQHLMSTMVARFLFLCQQEKQETVRSNIWSGCVEWLKDRDGDTKFRMETVMSGGLTERCLVPIDTCCAMGQC